MSEPYLEEFRTYLRDVRGLSRTATNNYISAVRLFISYLEEKSKEGQ